ncbi:hypothetical protein WJT86_03705 [Microvirga sp. W0021]|uniref:Uncharacterized protein n=1 Tax=Hohaiivirga grylli TaxID=3133970 RepID=A0ABV0BGR8_9HYPH
MSDKINADAQNVSEQAKPSLISPLYWVLIGGGILAYTIDNYFKWAAAAEGGSVNVRIPKILSFLYDAVEFETATMIQFGFGAVLLGIGVWGFVKALKARRS